MLASTGLADVLCGHGDAASPRRVLQGIGQEASQGLNYTIFVHVHHHLGQLGYGQLALLGGVDAEGQTGACGLCTGSDNVLQYCV